jgi:hypothetical protein
MGFGLKLDNVEGANQITDDDRAKIE